MSICCSQSIINKIITIRNKMPYICLQCLAQTKASNFLISSTYDHNSVFNGCGTPTNEFPSTMTFYDSNYYHLKHTFLRAFSDP